MEWRAIEGVRRVALIPILLACQGGSVGEAHWCDLRQCWVWADGDEAHLPTHWMPLPAPPTA